MLIFIVKRAFGELFCPKKRQNEPKSPQIRFMQCWKNLKIPDIYN